ncbi:hypothetical protein [Psychrobacter sp. JB193]|uniref:hypothetical protein n=1 Tax=Psychrobacter sp. JB193 TaxID=2024406 RepID=UPI000BAAEF8F|nr:hypothetical protein [Psychrobacter sp. JB193]PAT63136.1 hypothetical protein CIK80_11335 [Psychrobacter sp. JB193]
MFTSIQDDTINLNDVSRISRKSKRIEVYFISKKDPTTYTFEDEDQAIKVDLVILKELKNSNLLIR